MTDNQPAAPSEQLATAADVSDALTGLGLRPVLVGGMALVILGSRRVTRDFDFVISRPGEVLPQLLDVFYDRGFELVSRVNDTGDVVSTIGTRRIAAIRLRIDHPASAYFFNRQTRLRIDVLFDYPIPAATLAARGERITIRSARFCVASEEDLLRLKQIALANRVAPGDAQDIAFLEARKKPTP